MSVVILSEKPWKQSRRRDLSGAMNSRFEVKGDETEERLIGATIRELASRELRIQLQPNAPILRLRVSVYEEI